MLPERIQPASIINLNQTVLIPMKRLCLIILALISIPAFAQQDEAYKNYIHQAKSETKIDSEDKAVFNLLEEFYLQGLQSESGEVSPDIPKKTDKLYNNSETKNRHLLVMFVVYQNYISETAAVGKTPDSKFQVALMRDLENEFKTIYNKVPAIIYIYKAEALSSDGQDEESSKTLESGLLAYPDSVPLKVYKYMSSRNEALKKDLVKNHSNHWMVKQFEIQ